MKKTLLISFVALAGTAFAASNTYRVTLFQDSVVAGKTLKAGEYKISMQNGTAVIKEGKASIEVPAREETAAKKIASTELLYKNGTDLQQIRVGGTHTEIVFAGASPTRSGM
jgi:hypothetical protein